MICETCKAEGKSSRVYDRGRSTTLLNCTPFYDEQGRHHYHDRNTTTSGYECSNGHNWVVKSVPSCWCGWPNEQKAAPVEPAAPTNSEANFANEPAPPGFSKDDAVALMSLVGVAYALADADESTPLMDVVEKLESTVYPRSQVETVLRTAAEGRTP